MLNKRSTVGRPLEAYKTRTRERLSFTGYLTYCLARAFNQNKSMQAYLKGRKQLVAFDDVDVGLMIERQIGETRAPFGHVIRRANHKSFTEIHKEIRAVQSALIPPTRGITWFRSILILPWPFSTSVKVIMDIATRCDLTVRVSTSGTVSLSAGGMSSKGHSGWGIPNAPVTGYAWVGLGRVRYAWNELDAALHNVQTGPERRQLVGIIDVLLPRYHALARIRQAQGDRNGARTGKTYKRKLDRNGCFQLGNQTLLRSEKNAWPLCDHLGRWATTRAHDLC